MLPANLDAITTPKAKPHTKPLLGIRLRLMLLALLAVVPLTLDRVRVLEATRSERIGNFPARYGGEEFVLLLPGSGLEKALELAERLRRTVESLSFSNTQSPWGFVTISIGVASLTPERSDTVEKLVEAADAGLYAAKRRGRNTVVAHDPIVLSEAC